MAWTLPPPPAASDISGPEWRDWFYKLSQQTGDNSPDSAQNGLAGNIFGIRQSVSYPALTAVDTITLGASRVFHVKPVVHYNTLAVVESDNILAGQIFGS